MNRKPTNRQCEIARLVTKSEASDDLIMKELNSTSDKEWNETCKVLDNWLKKHDFSCDEHGMACLREYFITSATGDMVDEATLFIAYMNWEKR